MTAHTPGEWEAIPPASREHLWEVRGVMPSGETFSVSVIGLSGRIEEANVARLIAAAPELLQALATQVAFFDEGGVGLYDPLFWDKARAAIAKATGAEVQA